MLLDGRGQAATLPGLQHPSCKLFAVDGRESDQRKLGDWLRMSGPEESLVRERERDRP